MVISFATSSEESSLILSIVERALVLDPELDQIVLSMDLAATHCNGCPLRLVDLLNAETSAFTRDLHGIRRHLNRSTGIIDQARFRPEFAHPVGFKRARSRKVHSVSHRWLTPTIRTNTPSNASPYPEIKISA